MIDMFGVRWPSTAMIVWMRAPPSELTGRVAVAWLMRRISAARVIGLALGSFALAAAPPFARTRLPCAWPGRRGQGGAGLAHGRIRNCRPSAYPAPAAGQGQRSLGDAHRQAADRLDRGRRGTHLVRRLPAAPDRHSAVIGACALPLLIRPAPEPVTAAGRLSDPALDLTA